MKYIYIDNNTLSDGSAAYGTADATYYYGNTPSARLITLSVTQRFVNIPSNASKRFVTVPSNARRVAVSHTVRTLNV